MLYGPDAVQNAAFAQPIDVLRRKTGCSLEHTRRILAQQRRRPCGRYGINRKCERHTRRQDRAKAGLLHGLDATTHHQVLDTLAALAPTARMQPHLRYTDNGQILTSGGISAGIDASLYLVGKLLGQNVARETAAYMEYHPANPG
jgi:hypothetical protein